jgi:hypothetical protein
MMKWERHVTGMEAIRNAHTISVKKPGWKRSCYRLNCRWEDSMKMDLEIV